MKDTKTQPRPEPLLDCEDLLHLRGALVAVNSLLLKLPQMEKLNAAGVRIVGRACDARNALRVLLGEQDDGRLNLEALIEVPKEGAKL
jgi:hypothetical protein